MKKDWQIICESIYENPEEWESSGASFWHEPTRLSIWVANGFWFIAPKEGSLAFHADLVAKWKILKAYKWWLTWNLERKLTQKKLPEARV